MGGCMAMANCYPGAGILAVAGVVQRANDARNTAFRHESIVSLFGTFLTGVGWLLSAGRDRPDA